MTAFILVCSALASYLIGGVNGAILLSGICYRQDIREYGSGNPGFTNFKRVYGFGAPTVGVLLVDILKTVIPVLATALILNARSGEWQLGAQFAGLFCMFGHCFPVWYKFKGGKAFLAGATAVWFVDWRMALIAAGVFLILLFTLHYMSLSSITAAFVCPIALAVLGFSMWWVEILSIASAVLVIARHHANIGRLLRKEESKFYLGKKKA